MLPTACMTCAATPLHMPPQHVRIETREERDARIRIQQRAQKREALQRDRMVAEQERRRQLAPAEELQCVRSSTRAAQAYCTWLQLRMLTPPPSPLHPRVVGRCRRRADVLVAALESEDTGEGPITGARFIKEQERKVCK